MKLDQNTSKMLKIILKENVPLFQLWFKHYSNQELQVPSPTPNLREAFIKQKGRGGLGQQWIQNPAQQKEHTWKTPRTLRRPLSARTGEAMAARGRRGPSVGQSSESQTVHSADAVSVWFALFFPNSSQVDDFIKYIKKKLSEEEKFKAP